MLLSLSSTISTEAQVNVLTQRYNNARTGANLNETTLTPANVNVNQFGKLFSQPVDGYIYAQPLYVQNVPIQGKGTHNVVFVATEGDSVYAFEADDGTGANSSPLWQVSLIDSAHGAAHGAQTVNTATDISCTSAISPQAGVTATPVIDFNTQTMYVEAYSKESGSLVHRLHALDISSGAEKPFGPKVIGASVPGTGNGSSGGMITFDAWHQLGRAGLLLVNSTVYVAFGSNCDIQPYHGWIFAYDEASLTLKDVFNTTPNGIMGGVWMSGSGLSADTAGNVYAAVGNGDFDTVNIPAHDVGDSVIKLGFVNGKLSLLDYFAPFNQSHLEANDLDLGSGGTLLLPDQPGSHPHMLIQVGKTGAIRLIDRDQMGSNNLHYCTSSCNNTDPQIVQEIPNALGSVFGLTVYGNGTVYFGPSQDLIKAYSLTNGVLSTSPISSSSGFIGEPGTGLVVSANGTTNGILWGINATADFSSGPSVLMAYDATNLSQMLYSSDSFSRRDNPGVAVKFSVPVVANGKVYVGTDGYLSVFGLLTGTPTTGTPQFSPTGGSFGGSVTVALFDLTSDSSIFYTTDGSTPMTNSTKYTGPITINSSATVQAIAVSSGFLASAVGKATYIINGSPTITTQPDNQTVTAGETANFSVVASGTAPLSYQWQKNGSNIAGATSANYTTPATTSADNGSTFRVVVTNSVNSVTSNPATLTVNTQSGVINFAGGFSSTSGLQLNGGATLNGSRLQLTDGNVQEARSAFFRTPVNIQSFTTDFSFQLSNPVGDGITFAIQNSSATAVGPTGSGLGYGAILPSQSLGIPKSVAVKFDLWNNIGEGPDSTGMYVNGASPTMPAEDMSRSSVDLHSGDIFNVHITYDGTTLAWKITDASTGKSYSSAYLVSIPLVVGSQSAFVGFTGGAGGSPGGPAAIQEILTWTFSSGAPNTANNPIDYEAESLPATTTGPSNQSFTWPGFTDGVGTVFSATKVGDSVTYTLNVPRLGTYDVKVAAKKYPARGIFQLFVDGGPVGTIEDEYSQSEIWIQYDLGTVTIGSAGSHAFKFQVVGLNSASHDFKLTFDYIRLTPQ